MTEITQVATVTAYEAKDDTFSAVMRDEVTREIVRKIGYSTLSSATYAAKMMAWDAFGPVRYAKLNRKGEYLANVWQ
jgi:hypothetical protein